jgi:hypothetical protein
MFFLVIREGNIRVSRTNGPRFVLVPFALFFPTPISLLFNFSPL